MRYFFLTSQDFTPNTVRLAVDTMLSIALNIMAFAALYRHFGFHDQGQAVEFTDYIYFSAVTFSTLGYGDFAPAPDARLIAAAQAIIGNLHLGIIVGTAFLATQRRQHSEEKA